MSQSKRCTKCGETKPTTEFYRNRSTPDGFAYWCKKCTYANKLKRQREHKDEYNTYQRQYRETNLEKWPEYSRRAYAKHGDKIRARVSQRYREKSEEVKAYIKQWRRDNPEKCAKYSLVSSHKRRALIDTNDGSFTAEEWIALCEYHDHKCLCCGERKPLTIDHVIPISRGGSNDISNLQPLCQSCNSSKNTQTIDYR